MRRHVRASGGSLEWLEPRLHLVTGKGGVGKTTIVAAMAMAAVQRGRRPLIVELSERSRLQTLFDATIGFEPLEVASGVWACTMQLEPALIDYIQAHVKLSQVAERLAQTPALGRFVRAAPAVNEVLTLHRLRRLLDARRPRFDPIIVDFDATGHALMFLSLPEVFSSIVRRGPLRRLLASSTELLTDAERTRLHLVTIPEELPLAETEELYAELVHRFAVRTGVVIVNRMPDAGLPVPRPGDVNVLRDALEHETAPRTRCARLLALSEQALEQTASLERRLEAFARRVPLPIVSLETLRVEPQHADQLGPLVSQLAEVGQPVAAADQPAPAPVPSPSIALNRLIGPDRRLLVLVGPGGVGKTTTSAALAIAAARMGRRTLVLTIDPARRLAGALGLSALDDEERPVDVTMLEPIAPSNHVGSLSASMLDTKSSFDALIRRIAPAATVRQIFDNRVYRAFSRTLARSHAYIAMERLYAALNSTEYDFIVLDTPPARSAVEILDAPHRLVAFLQDGVVDAFVSDAGTRGVSAALGLFSVLAGKQTATELAAFVRVFFELRTGFAERAEAVGRALRGADCAFAVVATPSRRAGRDAALLAGELAERDIEISDVIINRSFASYPGEPTEPVVAAPRTMEPSWPSMLREAWTAAEGWERHVAEDNARRASAAKAIADDVAKAHHGGAVSVHLLGELGQAGDPLCELSRLLER